MPWEPPNHINSYGVAKCRAPNPIHLGFLYMIFGPAGNRRFPAGPVYRLPFGGRVSVPAWPRQQLEAQSSHTSSYSTSIRQSSSRRKVMHRRLQPPDCHATHDDGQCSPHRETGKHKSPRTKFENSRIQPAKQKSFARISMPSLIRSQTSSSVMLTIHSIFVMRASRSGKP